MEQKRQLLDAGDIITLGETEYRLESVEGCGGSSVVYRASYEDRLNRGCYHKVLIKELFPIHPQGMIYRDQSGNVCCENDGMAYMERCRQSFYRGNQANLELLELQPEQISGNLNSYKAYGTYYSILSVHGGKNLELILQEGEIKDLRSAAEGMKKILDALECFHKNGILHLDISPDNILMLADRALLIDYNSVWPMEQKSGEIRLFSVKEGYSAPEVRLRQEDIVGPSTDLYSVCAVFFRMLTGRRLSDEEIVGNKLGRRFPKDLEIFRNQPVSAAKKAVQIVSKGLNILARKRYQSVDEMREEIEELILRIDGKGISHSAVWEVSRKTWKEKRRPDNSYLEREVRTDSGEILPQSACLRWLQSGGRILLKGPGGMGKTRFLMELWRQGIKSYHPAMPVVVYIPLTDYQEAGEEPYYIRKCLLRHLCFSQQVKDMEAALHELNRLFDLRIQENQASFILLLDGLNEAGKQTGSLLKEIEDLGRRPGLGILVTDRSDSVKKYGLHGFLTAELLPLSEQTVIRELEQYRIPVPDEKPFLTMLGNPMMLSLYRKTMGMNLESGCGEKGTECAGSMEDMIGRYLDSLCIHEQRMDSGNQGEQLRHSYLIRHLLPEIAGEMKRRKKTLITLEELYRLIQKNYHILHQKSFGMAFPEYMGKSRLMFKEIANDREWFDYAVSEQLINRLNLLEKSGDGNYGLIHDNFIDYLANVSAENKRKIARYRRKAWGIKGCAAILLATVILTSGIAVWKSQTPGRMSEEDRQVVRNALSRLVMNLQVLDIQISGQQIVLENALSGKVLDGKPQAVEELGRLIDKKRQELQKYGVMANDGTQWLAELEMLKTDIPISSMQSLYSKPGDMETVMTEALDHLEESLCGEDSPYYDRAKREPLVKTYKEYLEAYSEMSYLELNRVLVSLDQESADTVLDSVQEMQVFSKFMLTYPLSGQTEEEISRQLEGAARQVKEKKDEMKMQNYKISLPGW